MAQFMHASVQGEVQTLEIPDPADEILPGTPWGHFDHLFTPAFWFSQAWYHRSSDWVSHYRLGDNLVEEIVACLLGGHGLPAEVGLAAFRRLKERNLLFHQPNIRSRICAALHEPLAVGSRNVRYRYPNRRADFISNALARLAEEEAPMNSDIALRAWLMKFDGIGPKTASWITRNFLDSDRVAILDIHVLRAGSANLEPARDDDMEVAPMLVVQFQDTHAPKAEFLLHHPSRLILFI